MSEHDPNHSEPVNDSPDGAQLDGEATTQPDQLHNLFALGADEEDPLAAMRDDPNYGALIRELEYIASEARRLFDPVEDTPSDEVWRKIHKELNKPNDT